MAGSRGRGQVHKPAATRRRELVDAAVRVIRRKGLLETTSRDVAAEAGTSSGLVAHYFDSQDDLLVAAFDLVATQDLARVHAAVQAAADPVAALRVLLDDFAPPARSWQYRMWIDVWAASARHDVLRRRSRELNLQWMDLVTEVIRRGVDRQVMRCADPEASAWRLLALMDGMSIQLVARQGRVARWRLQSWVHEAAAVEVGIPLTQLRAPAG